MFSPNLFLRTLLFLCFCKTLLSYKHTYSTIFFLTNTERNIQYNSYQKMLRNYFIRLCFEWFYLFVLIKTIVSGTNACVYNKTYHKLEGSVTQRNVYVNYVLEICFKRYVHVNTVQEQQQEKNISLMSVPLFLASDQ